MAIAPTGAIYKSLSFDGKNSRDYGVYITGEAVYNAPERDVELVTIPGRNGSFALDNGRFENIEVTYPAGIFAYTEEDFRQAISDFRNLLCSRKGYVRLSDEYNPDEYRMAVYKSGLDVSPAQLKAGEFDITFDCKPQRFLVSGEEAVDIGIWGDTETETGSIVTIEADDMTAIKDLTADIEPIQSGSGDPSPSNVRPISGHTDVVVTVADDYDNPTVSDTYTTALGTTVYGGTLDVTTGVLTVTHAFWTDDGTKNWIRNSDGSFYVASGTATSVQEADGCCCNYAPYAISFNDTNVFVRANGLVSLGKKWGDTYADATALKTAFASTPIQIVYELATPTTTTLTAQQISTLLGQNNVWASSGEVTVEFGQDPNKLPNPTLFESKPLLEVEGYGSIKLGDDTIKIENVDMGEVVVHEPYTPSIPNAAHSWFNLETSLLNVGDEITVPGFEITNNMKVVSSWSIVTMKTVDVLSTDKVASYSTGITGQHTSYVKFTPNEFTFNYGTAATSETASIEVYFDARSPGGAAVHPTITFTYYAEYDGANRIDFYFTGNNAYIALDSRVFTIPKITGDSSISALPTVMYIDLDIGEAYGDFSGVIASLNNAVQLPAQLPTLAVGHTDIEFDNTITSLKIRPRWFKI